MRVIFSMKAIILAGGFGTRLAKISGDKPKPLVEVAGKPILERQIEYLWKSGIRDIRLSLHHKADQIIAFCDHRFGKGKIEYLIEDKPLGTGGGIRFASRDLAEPFLVVNGDTLTDMDLLKFASAGAHAIACVYMRDARDFGLVDVRNGKAAAFLEKPKEHIPGFINAGYYLLDGKAFGHVEKEAFMIEQDVFPHLAKNAKLNAYVHDGYWIDVGTAERWERANNDYAHELMNDV